MKVTEKFYANLLPKDFDNFDCVKLSFGIYLILAFVLRAYVTWIMSVTNLKDHISIIQWIYPDPQLFYLHLCSGAIALFVMLLLFLRRPNAAPWVKYCWRRCHIFLILSLFFDLLFTTLGYFILHLQSLYWLLLQLFIVFLAVCYILKSKRFAINLVEFPEAIIID